MADALGISDRDTYRGLIPVLRQLRDELHRLNAALENTRIEPRALEEFKRVAVKAAGVASGMTAGESVGAILITFVGWMTWM